MIFCSAPQNVHCVAYFTDTGNNGTKNSVNFVTRLRSVCAAGLPHRPHSSVSIASWYRYPLVPKMITPQAFPRSTPPLRRTEYAAPVTSADNLPSMPTPPSPAPPAPPFSPTVALLTVGRVWEDACARALKPLGLTVRKYGLLGHVRGTPGISFSELARRSRITVQSAHSAVAGLVGAGLVDDGTAHAGAASTLRVTAAGETLLARAAEAVARLDGEFAERHPELTEALRAYVVREVSGGRAARG